MICCILALKEFSTINKLWCAWSALTHVEFSVSVSHLSPGCSCLQAVNVKSGITGRKGRKKNIVLAEGYRVAHCRYWHMLKAPLLGFGQMMDFDLTVLPLAAQVTFIHYGDGATCKSLLIQKEVI